MIGQYGHIPLQCGASDTRSRIANKKCFYNFGSTSKYRLATLFNRRYIQKIITIQLSFNENDRRNLYWSDLYNVKFVHNCSGSMLVMLVATSRSDKYTNFRPAGCPKTVLLPKVTLGINNFSVVCIEKSK